MTDTPINADQALEFISMTAQMAEDNRYWSSRHDKAHAETQAFFTHLVEAARKVSAPDTFDNNIIDLRAALRGNP